MRERGNLGAIFAAIGLVTCSFAFAQNDAQRQALGQRITSPISLDGNLDDAAWQLLPEQGDFKQYSPNPAQHRRSQRLSDSDTMTTRFTSARACGMLLQIPFCIN